MGPKQERLGYDKCIYIISGSSSYKPKIAKSNGEVYMIAHLKIKDDIMHYLYSSRLRLLSILYSSSFINLNAALIWWLSRTFLSL